MKTKFDVNAALTAMKDSIAAMKGDLAAARSELAAFCAFQRRSRVKLR
jgi:hypothetical protein